MGEQPGCISTVSPWLLALLDVLLDACWMPAHGGLCTALLLVCTALLPVCTALLPVCTALLLVCTALLLVCINAARPHQARTS